MPGGHGLVQRADRAYIPGLYGGGVHLLPDDRPRPRRCTRGCNVDRALKF